jgi:signal transduction histidine kinase
VQAHHGQITVRSKEGVGTTFDVYLPVKQPVEASNNGNTSA